MKAKLISLLIFLGGLAVVGHQDMKSAEVAHASAMEAPRPIFEAQADLQTLSMPCAYIRHTRFEHEPVSSKNTRCTKADRRDK